MNRNKIIYVYLTALFICSACDDGDIIPKKTGDDTGTKATMEVTFSGLGAWPSAYPIVLAAYGDDTETPLMSKQIAAPKSESETVSLTLNGLPEQTKTIGISILTKGRKLIYNYYTYAIDPSVEEVTLPVKAIDIASYDRIQQQVFDRYCVACHNATEQASAGLHLSNGISYKALVNQPATLSEKGWMLVQPGNAANSFLPHILTEDVVKYNHTDVLPEDELVTLIKTWIANGAKD